MPTPYREQLRRARIGRQEGSGKEFVEDNSGSGSTLFMGTGAIALLVAGVLGSQVLSEDDKDGLVSSDLASTSGDESRFIPFVLEPSQGAEGNKEENQSRSAAESLVASLSPEKEAAILKRLKELDAQDPVSDGSSTVTVRGVWKVVRLDARDDQVFDKSGKPVLYIGNPKIRLFPYTMLTDVASPQEFYAFILKTGSSPEDFARVVNHSEYGLIPYSPHNEYEFLPGDAFKRNYADCDGFALMACEGLQRLGDQFNPRVITQEPKGGAVGHAVCMYTQGGQTWIIDQGDPYQFTNLLSVKNFTGKIGDIQSMHEFARRGGAYLQWSVDPGSLKRMQKDLVVIPYADYVDDLSVITANFPEGWEQIDTLYVCYGYEQGHGAREFTEVCAVLSAFKEGSRVATFFKDGLVESEHHEPDGSLIQTYRNGDYQWIQFKDGQPISGQKRTGELVWLNGQPNY